MFQNSQFTDAQITTEDAETSTSFCYSYTCIYCSNSICNIIIYKEYDDFQKLPPFANIYSHQLKTMTAFSDSRSVCRFSFSKYLVHMHKLNLNVLCKSLPNRNGENVVCVNCNAHKSHTNRSKLTLKHWIENWNYHLLINCY